jgi:formimidoylglutamate deiminase
MGGEMDFWSADWALLNDGWVERPRIGVDARGVIASVEAGAAPAAQHFAGAMLPGMTNLHSHSFQRSFAGRTEFAGGGGDFWSWREAMYRAAGAIEPDTLAPVTAYLGMELLRGGFTSLVEFHYLQNGRDGQPYAHRPAMAEAVIEGAQQAGIGLTLLVGVYETGNFGGVPLQGGQKRFDTSPEAALRMVADLWGQQGGALRLGLSPHSLRAVPPRSLLAWSGGLAAMDTVAPIHIHLAEQQAEVEACVAGLGARPVEWVLGQAPVGDNWCFIHATHTSEAERLGMARAGVIAGLCPSTEGNLGDGIFGLPDFVAAGGRFGVGTDSHVGLDAFSELRLLEYSQRLRSETRNLLAGADGHSGRVLWQRAARGGAAAAARPVGVLAVGARADFVVIEATAETEGMHPDFWLDAAVFTGVRPAARQVVVGGDWVIRDGAHVREAAITAAYRRALKRIDGGRDGKEGSKI